MLFLCRVLARVMFPFQDSVTMDAGPDYLALYYYAKINPRRSRVLLDEWFPEVIE